VFLDSDGRCERELAIGVSLFRDPAMRAAGTARLGAGSQSLVDNGLEGARASAAFGATTETAIDLLGATREIICSADGVADIVVSEHVAGTNNHYSSEPVCEMEPIDIQERRPMQKEKPYFQVIPN
jgi:hypothetical protein